MTRSFIEDFNNRRRQVRHYVLTVASAEKASASPISRAKEGRLLTLRAGTFLVLYNLVEASTRATIESIHDRITTEQIPFEKLSKKIRREVVRRFKINADPDVHYSLADLSSTFVSVALDQTVELSGNVDARKIRELADGYGFSCDTDRSKTRAGVDLLTIKTNRNDLAHGRKTFEDVGRDYPAGELLLLTRRSLNYMGEVLSNVEFYLDRKGYLKPEER